MNKYVTLLSAASPCLFVPFQKQKVTCFEYADQLLPREDPDAAKCLEGALLEDGLEIRLGRSSYAVPIGTKLVSNFYRKSVSTLQTETIFPYDVPYL